MDPVPIYSYWFLSYLSQSQVDYSFDSFPFAMNLRKLIINILKIKLREEKITRKL